MAAYFESGNENLKRLESMVDATSLAVVLEALSYICREKAVHINSNWQDKRTAQTWTYAAQRCEQAAVRVGV